MRRLGFFLVALLVFATGGCAPTADVEADGAAIRSALDVGMLGAAKEKNVEGVLVYYTDDASLLPPDAPIASGKEAIRAVWTQLLANPDVSWQTTGVEVSSASDLAYATGTYEITVDASGDNPVSEIGKWVVVLKKQSDGTWKQIVGIFNTDQSAASE